VEVSGVTMNAVRMKDKLRLFWNDPAHSIRMVGLDQIREMVQLTDFQILLCLYLCPRCALSRLGLGVEAGVLRCCSR
jgi:hypothetical protein